MARHVLNGELPAFFWGQAFKGVPEVYASAGAFALFGSSVTVLKAVTLAFFAVYVGLNFLLLDKVASRWIAVSASSLLIAAPPALVFWSLDASAEYVLIMLLGTALLLDRRQVRGQRSDTAAVVCDGSGYRNRFMGSPAFRGVSDPAGNNSRDTKRVVDAAKGGHAQPIRARAGRDCRHLPRPRDRGVSDRRVLAAHRAHCNQRDRAAENGAHCGRSARAGGDRSARRLIDGSTRPPGAAVRTGPSQRGF